MIYWNGNKTHWIPAENRWGTEKWQARQTTPKDGCRVPKWKEPLKCEMSWRLTSLIFSPDLLLSGAGYKDLCSSQRGLGSGPSSPHWPWGHFTTWEHKSNCTSWYTHYSEKMVSYYPSNFLPDQKHKFQGERSYQLLWTPLPICLPGPLAGSSSGIARALLALRFLLASRSANICALRISNWDLSSA